MSYNPYQQNPQPQTGRTNSAVAKEKVKAPAILLIVNAVISIFGCAISGGIMAFGSFAMPEEQRDEMLRDPNMTPELLDGLLMFYGWGGILFAIFGLLVGVFVIFGAVRMLGLKSWGLGLTASILSLVPCFQGCCLLSIPVGIYALVVLSDPQVKSAFK